MKIAFIGQKGIPARDGGVEKYVENLSFGLANLGQEVFVYNRYNYLPEKIKEFKDVKIIHKPYFPGKNFAAITHAFISILDALGRKFDVIHFQGIGPSLLIFLFRIFNSKVKIVATLHSFDYYNDKWSYLAKKMLRLGERLMCKTAHQVIVLTESSKEYVKIQYGIEAALIPNGAKLYNNESYDKITPWGLAKDEYIVSVSRIIKLKGLQYLIEAFRQVKTDKKLVIVGDGDYLSELKKMAVGDDRIVFTGNQGGRTLDQLYANAFLFVQSSEMEGLSIALLEAMAHQTACLVSDIPANQDAIGQAGFEFKSKDIDDLKTRLQNLMDNPDQVKVKAQLAYQRVRDHFSWDDISRRVLEIYKK